MTDSTKALLQTHLSLHVNLYITYLQQYGGPSDLDIAEAQRIGQLIAEKGDNLLYRSSKRGETARLIDRLAFGVAVLSFSPGGVKVFDQHWETTIPVEETDVSA